MARGEQTFNDHGWHKCQVFQLIRVFGTHNDADGREEVERWGLPATGTLGILEHAALQGVIDLPTALARLQATTFRARPALFQELLAHGAARKAQQR
jgi:hypothetical protein